METLDAIMEGLQGLWWVLIALYFYLLPSVIAAQRQSCMTGAIFFLNLLFGWTLIVWIACFIWACTTNE